jgi:hypothetical protein
VSIVIADASSIRDLTMGTLDLAAKRGLVDLRESIDRLRPTSFRHRKEIVEGLLAEYEGQDS